MEAEHRAEQRAMQISEQRAEQDTKIRMSKIPAKLVWHRTVEYVSRTHSAMGPSSVRIIPGGSDLVVADWSISRTPPIWLSSLTFINTAKPRLSSESNRPSLYIGFILFFQYKTGLVAAGGSPFTTLLLRKERCSLHYVRQHL